MITNVISKPDVTAYPFRSRNGYLNPLFTFLGALSRLWLATPIVLLLAGCSKDEPTPVIGGGGAPSLDPNGWLIPSSRVVDGGPGKDGIPSIDQPQFSPVSVVDFLRPDDLVLGINVDGDIRAYPHPILDWHEIVNDVVGSTSVAITYCPLTGTGIGWDRTINGQETTFGVSGLLFNSNLIPYDRASNSNWSQILLKSVNGGRVGTDIETVHLIETTWETWRQMFPNSQVLNLNTGFQRDYSRYPYGSFRTNHDLLIFSVNPDDARLPRKERGLGVLIDENTNRFYRLESFAGDGVTVIEDALGDTELVVAGSKERNFVVAYDRRLDDGTLLTFQTPEADVQSAAVMIDNEGNQWDLFGEVIEGPRRGARLKPATSFMGYWFSWGAFYAGIDIYQK